MNALLAMLSPWRWLLAGALIAALLAGVWRLDIARQQIGYDRAQAENTALALEAEKAARVKEQAMQATTTKAIQDAKTRETKLAADAAAARRTADGLRRDVQAATLRLSEYSRDAVERYAGTAGVVLAECSDEYRALAQDADRLANDRQTLIEGWPK